jgi:hypothetical protein
MLLNKFPGGGVSLEAATATPSKVLSPFTFFAGENEEIQTGSIPSKAAQTYTPGTSAQIIEAGQYLSGDQTISGDADLVAENIRTGKNIFGVDGTGPGLPDTITAGETILRATFNTTLSSNTAYADRGSGYIVTINKPGTYRFRYVLACYYSANLTTYARLTKNGSVVSGSEIAYPSANVLGLKYIDVACAAGDVIKLQAYTQTGAAAYFVAYFGVSVLASNIQTELNTLITLS